MFDAFVEECPQRLERHRRDQFISKSKKSRHTFKMEMVPKSDYLNIIEIKPKMPL